MHGQTLWCLTLISSLRVYNISSLDITSSGLLLVSVTWNETTVFSRCQWRYLKFVKKRCPPSRQAHYASLCVSSTWHVPALLSHPPQMTAPLTTYSCNGIWELLKCPSLHFFTRQWLRLSVRDRGWLQLCSSHRTGPDDKASRCQMSTNGFISSKSTSQWICLFVQLADKLM